MPFGRLEFPLYLDEFFLVFKGLILKKLPAAAVKYVIFFLMTVLCVSIITDKNAGNRIWLQDYKPRRK
jgi:hypothetical protein